MKNKFIIGTLFSILLLFSPNVRAASFIDNQVVDANKTWTIKFKDNVVFDDATKQSITVIDSKGTVVNIGVKLGQDSKAIIVTAPQGGYTAGESYTLNVGSKVHSSKGKALKNEYKVHFSIEKCNNDSSVVKSDPYVWAEKNILVAHALGGVNGKTYSNSLEAFEYNYLHGQRVFEVDLTLTSDGDLVAKHDWSKSVGDMLQQDIPSDKVDKPLTLNEFKNMKIYREYTPLTFEDIIGLMKKYNDAYIITDTKDMQDDIVKKQFKNIVNTANKVDPKILDRIIPQIYNEDMLKGIKAVYNFKSIIYTLYQTRSSDDEVVKFATENGIRVVTMGEYRYSKEFEDKLSKNNIYTYIHTINDVNLVNKYLKQGVSGFYTDFLLPESLILQRN